MAAEQDKNKPRDKGIGEYTRDFVGNIFGRDSDDERQTTNESGQDRPWDKGIGEYTRDFVGSLFGRDHDSQAENAVSKNDQNKGQQDTNAKSSGLGSLVDKAAEAARQAQDNAKAQQDGSVGSVVERAAEAARQAQEHAKEEQRQSVNSVAERAAKEAREAAEHAQQQAQAKPRVTTQGHTASPAQSAPASGLSDAERKELEQLRERVQDLEQQQASPAPAAPKPERTYTVQPGDSLRAISQRFYGDEMQWKRIYEANRDSIANPDLIHVGQTFKIPE